MEGLERRGVRSYKWRGRGGGGGGGRGLGRRIKLEEGQRERKWGYKGGKDEERGMWGWREGKASFVFQYSGSSENIYTPPDLPHTG